MVGHNSRTIGRKKRAFQLAKEFTLVTLMPNTDFNVLMFNL